MVSQESGQPSCSLPFIPPLASSMPLSSNADSHHPGQPLSSKLPLIAPHRPRHSATSSARPDLAVAHPPMDPDKPNPPPASAPQLPPVSSIISIAPASVPTPAPIGAPPSTLPSVSSSSTTGSSSVSSDAATAHDLVKQHQQIQQNRLQRLQQHHEQTQKQQHLEEVAEESTALDADPVRDAKNILQAVDAEAHNSVAPVGSDATATDSSITGLLANQTLTSSGDMTPQPPPPTTVRGQQASGSGHQQGTGSRTTPAESKGDPKKTCIFCGREFSHAGSLGRHLDLKKGTRFHPLDEVERLRANVKRRGDPNEVRERRARRAKLYNSREDVRERARLRRKLKERTERAREMAQVNFIHGLGAPQISDNSSFPAFVFYFLPPSRWPAEGEMTSQAVFDLVVDAMENVTGEDTAEAQLRSKLDDVFNDFKELPEATRTQAITHARGQVLAGVLGKFSAHEIGVRDRWIAIEEQSILATLDQQGYGDGDSRSPSTDPESQMTGIEPSGPTSVQ